MALSNGSKYLTSPSEIPVKASGGKTERSLGDRFAEVFNVKDYGALGNYDPNTETGADDYPAIQACFDAAKEYMKKSWNAAKVVIPPGIYRMSQRAECMVADRTDGTSTSLTGPVGIVVEGAGEASTLLYAENSNTEGLLYLYTNRNNETFEVGGIGFISDLSYDSETNNGVALKIESTLGKGDAGWGGQGKYSVWAHDLYIGGWNSGGGSTQTNNHNFLKGIEINNKWFPMIERVRMNGQNELNEFGGRSHGIHMFSCYTPYLDKVYVQGGWDIGAHIEGNYGIALDLEDFRFTNCFFVRQNIGLFIDRDHDTVPQLNDPGGAICNIHVNANHSGLKIKRHRQITISNLYGYAPAEGRIGDELLPSMVHLVDATDITMSSVQFLEPGFYNSDSNASVGLRCEGSTEAIYVDALWGNGGIGAHINCTAAQKSIFLAGIDDARTTALWAPHTPVVDLTGSSVKYGMEQDSGANNDKWFMEGRKTPTGTGANMFMQFRGRRNNYASGFSGSSAVIQDIERNTLGEDVVFSQITMRIDDNTDGSEDAALVFSGQSNGTGSKALLELNASTTSLETAAVLLVNIGGGLVARRVKIGAQNTGPGGSGRALYIDN